MTNTMGQHSEMTEEDWEMYRTLGMGDIIERIEARATERGKILERERINKILVEIPSRASFGGTIGGSLVSLNEIITAINLQAK